VSAATPPRAELLADGGEAAAADEFFRCRPFLEAEGVTHTLRIEAGGGVSLAAPLIVRPIPGTEQLDAISPYGYPGISDVSEINHPTRRFISETSLDPASVDFSATGLVSLFVRHTLGAPPIAGASERNVVQVADPALPPKRRGSDRNQINKNLRRGYRVRIVPGPEATAEERAAFLVAYEQTMRRTEAAERYFFGAAYFDRILSSPLARLVLALAPDETIAAGSILVRSDGFLHYYLSGSADAHLRDSPMKNVVAALVELSEEERTPLNLGGGIARGDRLEEFKRGFANREQPWLSSEIVCDETAYARLSGGRDNGGFFPAYRAPL
jgi:hypothetical protein